MATHIIDPYDDIEPQLNEILSKADIHDEIEITEEIDCGLPATYVRFARVEVGAS